MQKSKIKNVYYSNSPGIIMKENVASMNPKTAHITSGIKKYMDTRSK